MDSIYTERENILPHHAEWLDGCGAVWWINRVRFGLRHDISEVSFIAFCVSDNTFLTSYDESYTHIPTGTEFCERVAEILGLPKPTFEDKFIESEQAIIDRAKDNPMQPFVDEMTKKGTATDHIPDVGQKVDISKTETTINGMAIEVSRLSEEEISYLKQFDNSKIMHTFVESKYISFDLVTKGINGFGTNYIYKNEYSITESPTEFLKYVAQQTGKEYKKTAAYDVQKFVANREGMAERLAKASFTNEELMDLPDEEIGKLNFGKPTYPHKTYRILDSLDGIPLDTRIPLSEWIPPVGQKVLVITENWFMDGFFERIESKIIFETAQGSKALTLDGHWMRIV